MKTFSVTLIAAISMTMFSIAANAGAPAKVPSEAKAKLSTNIRFDGLDTTGRYQAPLGATVGIDADREALGLIDFRTHYKDRAKRAQSGR